MAVAFSNGVFTPDGFADALSKFGPSIRPSVVRALKRTAKIPRAIYLAKATKHGILRNIFGGKPKGLGGLVRTKVVDKGNVFVLAMELRGLAAMQEAGGRTKPHRILPKSGKALKLKMSSIGTGFAMGVLHPGSQIRQFPVATSAMTTAAPKIQSAIDKEICTFSAGGVLIARAG
jgi:hypothetical protein